MQDNDCASVNVCKQFPFKIAVSYSNEILMKAWVKESRNAETSLSMKKGIEQGYTKMRTLQLNKIKKPVSKPILIFLIGSGSGLLLLQQKWSTMNLVIKMETGIHTSKLSTQFKVCNLLSLMYRYQSQAAIIIKVWIGNQVVAEIIKMFLLTSSSSFNSLDGLVLLL